MNKKKHQQLIGIMACLAEFTTCSVQAAGNIGSEEENIKKGSKQVKSSDWLEDQWVENNLYGISWSVDPMIETLLKEKQKNLST